MSAQTNDGKVVHVGDLVQVTKSTNSSQEGWIGRIETIKSSGWVECVRVTDRAGDKFFVRSRHFTTEITEWHTEFFEEKKEKLQTEAKLDEEVKHFPSPDDHLDNLAFSLAALNLDGSNRHTSINSSSKLHSTLNHLTPSLSSRSPSLITFSEYPFKNIPPICLPTYEKSPALRICNANSILTCFDANQWELQEYVDSTQGRYLACRYQHRASKCEIYHFSCHLPHKRNSQRARSLLAKALEELGSDVHGCVVSGDFNASPAVLEGFLPADYQLVFGEMDPVTTRNQSRIDNVVVPKDWQWLDKHVAKQCDIFSHYPITTELALPLM
eukprot:TRINITY_DN16995_c0_g1_i5.p1 TRINITY_DN16995_c0_g1~~TRINITY_DN16995_c0_g1_i5.p1  ORF type:complete len:327 (-),score=62.99 TRINITY_DN16995_c0_g1_i5:191-1171(-)